MSGDDAAGLSAQFSPSSSATTALDTAVPTSTPTLVQLDVTDATSAGPSNEVDPTAVKQPNGLADQDNKDVQSREILGEAHNGALENAEAEGAELVSDASLGSVDSTGSGEDGHEWAHDDEHESKRVKVYELIGSRWVDQGTAFCFGQFSEETNEALLLARAEANYNNVILSTAIRSNDVYQRQQDTLIVWTEPDGVDYALSFQDPEGCSEVWNFILEVQRHMNAADEPAAIGSSSPLIGPEPLITTASIIRSGHLPRPQLGNMAQIEGAIKSLSKTQAVKERICEYIQHEEYIKSMIELMHTAEDLENIESLHAICSCMQTILMMNDHSMYEHILADDIFFGVVGILEYDPEFPTHKANYREFLQQTSQFHQPIAIRDEVIQRKIHHTYRLQFLKDVVLARALDDSTFNVLNSCILFNQIDIITHVQSDVSFLREVVGLYVDEDMLSGGGGRKKEKEAGEIEAEKAMRKSDEMDVDTSAGTSAKTNGHARSASYAFAPPDELSDDDIRLRREVVLLIQQLCVMGKNVQLPARMALFRTLVDRGILFGVQWALALPEKEESSRPMISAGGEILGALLDHDLNGVRGHVLKQVIAIDKEREAGKRGVDKAETILALLCRMMASSRDMAVQSQIGDALKVLLEIPQGENDTLAAAKVLARGKDDPGTEKFLDYFYKYCIETLFKPFSDVPEYKHLTEPTLFLTREKVNLYVYLCDMLCSFALQHSFRSHFFILSSNITPRVASLLTSREKHLRLSAFRFFRITLKLNNKNLINHLLKHDVFKPILKLTIQESRRDSLVCSSCHEFFEHIRRENYKELIMHCMSKYEPEIKRLSEMRLAGPYFTAFIRRWEINNQPPPPEGSKSPKPDIRALPQAARMEAEALEDDYFSADDYGGDEDEEPPFIHLSLFQGPMSPQQKIERILKRKRQNGSASATTRGFRPSTPTPPISRNAPLGNLVDYDDEDEIELVPSVDDVASASSSKASSSRSVPSPPPGETPSSPRLLNKDGPPRRLAKVDEDEEDNALEALVRGKPSGIPQPVRVPELNMGPLRPAEKRRRDEDEDDELELLASKAKRPDLGTQKVAKDAASKKMKLKFGATNLGGTPAKPPLPSETGAKDGDTG